MQAPRRSRKALFLGNRTKISQVTQFHIRVNLSLFLITESRTNIVTSKCRGASNVTWKAVCDAELPAIAPDQSLHNEGKSMTNYTPAIESTTVTYKTLSVDGLNIAYREAGKADNPKLVLLHGFPSSSHQYR